MKMIMAYIRTECSADVMRDLYNAGVGESPAMWCTEDAVNGQLFSIRPAHLKLGVVCPDERCDEIVRLIGRTARTGNRGDGIITVLDVDNVQRIRELEASS